MNAPTRNVRVTLDVEIHLDGAAPEGLGVDDQTYERASDLMHEVWGDGDPSDVLKAVLVVRDVQWMGA